MLNRIIILLIHGREDLEVKEKNLWMRITGLKKRKCCDAAYSRAGGGSTWVAIDSRVYGFNYHIPNDTRTDCG
jgi:hypothetical protein